MLHLENQELGLHVAEDASSAAIEDRVRGVTWALDTSRVAYRRYGDRKNPVQMSIGRAERSGESISVEYRIPEGVVRHIWSLRGDCIEVELDTEVEGAELISLPGPFHPKEGPVELALPCMQGVLVRDARSLTDNLKGFAGNHGFSMSMGGILGRQSAMLVVQNTIANWMCAFGPERDGGMYLHMEEQCCPVDGWGRRLVRLYFTDPNLTALCKRYRSYLLETGQFVTWQEKIEAKPILSKLFGALMTFTGYNAAPEIDRVASAKKLKDYGFETILLYPVRICAHSLGFKMGGDDPIWMSDSEIAELRSMGVLVSPWGWVVEGLDDGSEEMRRIYRHDQNGKIMPNWKIDDFQWYLVCTDYQREHMLKRFQTDMREMDWIHFDVNAGFEATPCFNVHHDLHGSIPMGRRGDVQAVAKLLSPETVGNRITSSEVFVGHFAPYYDIGTGKFMPGADAANLTPVPMTMLVYHDSTAQDWWELDNYNEVEGWGIKTPDGWSPGRVGSGKPKLKAAIDALMGCPPNVFPFGRQYGWANVATHETYSVSVHFDDPTVQEALKEALPVARLHKKIGMCEIREFDFLSDDRLVQTTLFSNGTRVTANLSEEDQYVPGCGTLPRESWRESE